MTKPILLDGEVIGHAASREDAWGVLKNHIRKRYPPPNLSMMNPDLWPFEAFRLDKGAETVDVVEADGEWRVETNNEA